MKGPAHLGALIRNYYIEHGLRYAWRIDRTPYRVYVSEVALQRTRAPQVEPVFTALMDTYDNFRSLLEGFDNAITIMRPLGRPCRFDYLLRGLNTIVRVYDGKLPVSREELTAIPGVGPYIAAAVRVFAFGLRDTIVDTNVVRVLGRVFGVGTDASTRRQRSFLDLAERCVPIVGYAEYSYGILDLASSLCKPHSPNCCYCSLRQMCDYAVGVRNAIDRIPAARVPESLSHSKTGDHM